MSESLHSSLETQEQEKVAEYTGGKVEYSVVGDASEHNPVVLVPGFTVGRLVQRNFANTLSEEGKTEVIFSDQPDAEGKFNIDDHAEALLAILKNEDLTSRPVDVITHSMGSLIYARAAELAKERGIHSFDSRLGSHSVFVAPAGSNDKENIFYLGGRFSKFMAKSQPYGKELDPTGEWMKAGAGNLLKNKAKTAKEIWQLSKKQRIYKNLGALGLKPHIIGFASDDLYPHKTIGSVVEDYGHALDGYSVPIDSTGVGADSFKDFKQKSGLSGKEAKKAWAHHYRNAGHNDFLFHPERTVKAILPILQKDNKPRTINKITV